MNELDIFYITGMVFLAAGIAASNLSGKRIVLWVAAILMIIAWFNGLHIRMLPPRPTKCVAYEVTK